MSAHLLSLADLHAAAPGILDVVFGPDGNFEGALPWTCPIWGSVTRWGEERPPSFVARWTRYVTAFVTPEPDGLAGVRGPSLDLRVPTVAARLLRLCWRAARPSPCLDADHLAEWLTWLLTGQWSESDAARLAALTLALAPRIAALKETP